jgi:hypothetical protein
LAVSWVELAAVEVAVIEVAVIQVLARLVAARLLQPALGLRASVVEPARRGVLRGFTPLGLLSRRPKIYDITHASLAAAHVK